MPVIITGLAAIPWRESISYNLPAHDITYLEELGLHLVLFSVGMDVDITGLVGRFRLCLVQGVGKILSSMLVMWILALIMGQSAISSIVFALCTSFSSTFTAINWLKKHDDAHCL